MIALFFLLGLAPLAALGFWLMMRDWYLEWGATDAEALGTMGGDGYVQTPNSQATLAITIAAGPEEVWPWLVQMGYRRGGLYSYDWLDRLFGYLDRPSAEQVLAEFQQLNPGDLIPLGRGPAFPVIAVDPFRTLVLGGSAGAFRWTWQFDVRRIGPGRTRLISRNRANVPRTPGTMIFMALLEPAAFIMTRKMLLGIKRRAESLVERRRHDERHAA